MDRHALYVTGDGMSLAREARFASEQQLHDAIALYPERIPHGRFGLGRLTVLAREFGCASGYIDLILVDEFGRLVICEIKKGAENSDVRRVIAQMLDYGAALWQTDVDVFERDVARCEPTTGDSLAGSVVAKLGALAEPEAFRLRVRQCLADGDFVFLYVVRDLDPRTERVIDYLTTRPRIPLFVVEVDNYLSGSTAVLVPRAVGVPPWVNTATTPETAVSAPHADALIQLMDQLAERLHVEVRHAATGKRYYSRLGDAYIGVYRSSRGTEVGLAGLEEAGHPDVAAAVRAALRASGLSVNDRVQWPMFRCEAICERRNELSTTAFQLFLQWHRALGTPSSQRKAVADDRENGRC
jgi:hypothetical protein